MTACMQGATPLFFFSSTTRHTRCGRDWSSDVCSSDLTVELHPENYRNLLLALAGDVRVILIKTADRLQVMRNLDIYDSDARHRLVSETSYLYAPLAHRLGLYSINSELQDLCLKYQNPSGYSYIINRLKETETERENFVAEFVKPLEKKLQEKDFRFSMKARTKSIFSIWNKMQKKKVSFDEVMDLFAIRVILDSKAENEKTRSEERRVGKECR